MMLSYMARQPIFKKNMKVFGYELFFREGMKNYFPAIDGDIATSELLSNTFLTSDLSKYTNSKKAFVNFTSNLLVKQIPLLFSKDLIVVEILEDVKVNDAVIDICKELSKKGYTIALDDFIYHDDIKPLVALADILKFDFIQSSIEEIQRDMDLLKKYNLTYLAEKIETHEEFKIAVEMGFRYFQGYFFSKPEIIQGRKIAPVRINLLRVMSEIHKKDFDFNQLEKYISQDVALSYKLLRYINSAYYRRVNEIFSIKHAIILLGKAEIRRFISFMAMSKLCEEKPDELIRISAIRAKFCELIGLHYGQKTGSEYFTMGLFSLIDAIMDDSAENIMQQLPLSENVKNALVYRKGDLIDYLEFVKFYEKGDWENATLLAKKLKIDEAKLPELYVHSLDWGGTLTDI